MRDMYEIAGTSRQAMWGYRRRQRALRATVEQVVSHIGEKRKNHKRMGCRSIYHTAPERFGIGRDRFEQIGFENGFRLKSKRNAMKTTWGQRVEIYPNLLEGAILTGINQAWQSDIFYLKVEGWDFYGVSIEDVYSRELLALHISRSLRAEENIKALKKAVGFRKGTLIKGCIYHSDRGSQYIDGVHKKLVLSLGLRPSMAKMPQENAYVERVQGTVKNDYFYEHDLTLKNVHRLAQKIQRWYNDERPHRGLGMMAPTDFRKHVNNLPDKEAPETRIYQGFSNLSTYTAIINKKKKEAKKKKSTSTSLN